MKQTPCFLSIHLLTCAVALPVSAASDSTTRGKTDTSQGLTLDEMIGSDKETDNSKEAPQHSAKP